MHLSKSWHLNTKLSQVQFNLVDLHRFGALHPLIDGVQEIGRQTNVATYRVRERPFRFFPLRISYQAKVHPDGPRFEITGLPFMEATFVYALKPFGPSKTDVSLNIEISGAISPIRKILSRKMMDAQDVIMANMTNAADER